MSVTRGTRTLCDLFDRAQVFSTTPGHNGWTIKDNSSSGAPTYLGITEDGGGAKLTMAATSEEEVLTLYQNDVLPMDLAKLQYVEAVVKVAGIDAVTDVVVGVGSAQNDTEDSVAVNAWLKIDGSVSTSALVAETDDGTTDNDDVATGATLGSTYKRLTIDFTAGLTDVRFFVDGERVAAGTTFDMSAISSGQNVQPFIQIHKASGTGVGSITIAKWEAQYTYAYGA